jgi:hypothetical protein
MSSDFMKLHTRGLRVLSSGVLDFGFWISDFGFKKATDERFDFGFQTRRRPMGRDFRLRSSSYAATSPTSSRLRRDTVTRLKMRVLDVSMWDFRLRILEFKKTER